MVALTDPLSSSTSSNLSPLLSCSVASSGKDILFTITPPKEPGSIDAGRAPLDLVLVIDISYSMNDAAPVPDRPEEVTGLTVLDIVKHAAKTVISTMSDQDRVSIVVFSDSARTLIDLTFTTDEGRKKLLSLVDQLQPDGMTNIWDGLKHAMSVLVGRKAVPSPSRSDIPVADLSSRIASIFLLTDGEPNIIPPRGHLPMLQQFYRMNPGKCNFKIDTFGFGNILDSKLLSELADEGQGTYRYIPDVGIIGTVFVHAIANTYVTYAERCVLTLRGSSSNLLKNIQVPGGFNVNHRAEEVEIHFVTIQYGQTRDLIVTLDQPITEKTSLVATVELHPWFSPESLTASCTISYLDILKETEPNLLYHKHRLDFVSSILENTPAVQASRNRSYDRSKIIAHANIQKQLFEQIKIGIDNSFPHRSSSTAAANALALAVDIEKECIPAVESENNYWQWGRHYLPAFARAHQQQQCSNFIDVSVQVYGRDSPLFQSKRDEADMLFDNLPPPVPQHRPASATNYNFAQLPLNAVPKTPAPGSSHPNSFSSTLVSDFSNLSFGTSASSYRPPPTPSTTTNRHFPSSIPYPVPQAQQPAAAFAPGPMPQNHQTGLTATLSGFGQTYRPELSPEADTPWSIPVTTTSQDTTSSANGLFTTSAFATSTSSEISMGSYDDTLPDRVPSPTIPTPMSAYNDRTRQSSSGRTPARTPVTPVDRPVVPPVPHPPRIPPTIPERTPPPPPPPVLPGSNHLQRFLRFLAKAPESEKLGQGGSH